MAGDTGRKRVWSVGCYVTLLAFGERSYPEWVRHKFSAALSGDRSPGAAVFHGGPVLKTAARAGISLNDASGSFPAPEAHLLRVETGHVLHALPVGLGGLAETLLLLPSLQRGLGAEVLVVWVLRVLELHHSRGRLLPLPPLLGGAEVLLFLGGQFGVFPFWVQVQEFLTYPFSTAGPLGVGGRERGRGLGHHSPDGLLVQQRGEELRGLLQGEAARRATSGRVGPSSAATIAHSYLPSTRFQVLPLRLHPLLFFNARQLSDPPRNSPLTRRLTFSGLKIPHKGEIMTSRVLVADQPNQAFSTFTQ